MRSLIIGLVASSLASAASAQAEFHPLQNYPTDDVIDGANADFAPVAGFDRYPHRRSTWTRTLIYDIGDEAILSPTGLPGPRYVLKRRLYSVAIDGTVGEQTRWADSRTCNEMFLVLDRMTELRAPSVDVGLRPWIPAPPEPTASPMPGERIPVDRIVGSITIHGTTTRVWSDSGYNPGGNLSGGSVSMWAASGLIVEWAEFAEEWLEDCWQDEQPPFE